MNEHDELIAAEQEMLDHACEVLEEAIAVRHLVAHAVATERPAWRWGAGDPYDALEAASAIRAFPPSWSP